MPTLMFTSCSAQVTPAGHLRRQLVVFERIELAVTVWEVDENIKFICRRQYFADLCAFATAKESILSYVDVTAWTETTHSATALDSGHYDLGPTYGLHRGGRCRCQANKRQGHLSRKHHFGFAVRTSTFAPDNDPPVRRRSH